MSRRESRTISVLEGDWDRWTRTAGERGIAERGRAYSVSEYIRRAVEAYAHGNGESEGAPVTADSESRGAGNGVVHHRSERGASRQRDSRIVGTSGKLGMGGRMEGDAAGEGGGTMKREAKAPNTREGDPAEGPLEGGFIIGLRRAPVPKESQTRRAK